jgi:N-methylhydantoinase B
LTLLPVFVDDELMAWTCNMAHWSDIGGLVPGSISPISTELFQEGIIIPAIKIYNKGVLNESALQILEANSRLPTFVVGDFQAGIASAKTGAERITDLVKKYGKETFNKALDKYYDYGEQLTLAGLKKLKKGTFTASEVQDLGVIQGVNNSYRHQVYCRSN